MDCACGRPSVESNHARSGRSRAVFTDSFDGLGESGQRGRTCARALARSLARLRARVARSFARACRARRAPSQGTAARGPPRFAERVRWHAPPYSEGPHGVGRMGLAPTNRLLHRQPARLLRCSVRTERQSSFDPREAHREGGRRSRIRTCVGGSKGRRPAAERSGARGVARARRARFTCEARTTRAARSTHGSEGGSGTGGTRTLTWAIKSRLLCLSSSGPAPFDGSRVVQRMNRGTAEDID